MPDASIIIDSTLPHELQGPNCLAGSQHVLSTLELW